MADAMGFSVSLEEHGRHECAATILLGLLYPEWDRPDGTLETIYSGLCGYLLRTASEQQNGWAEDHQMMRPIHAFASEQHVARARKDIETRLPKALWTGLVASELVTGARIFGNPGEQARFAVDPIAADMAGYLGMSATNFKSRAWRPWARASHLCAAFAQLHLLGVRNGQPTFNLIEFLIGSDAAPLAFAAMAASLEDAVAAHSKIPATRQNLVLIRVTEKSS